MERFYEFARIALNYETLKEVYRNLIDKYINKKEK